MSGDLQRVRLLLGAGADLLAENHVGNRAADCAAENGQGEVAAMLARLETGARVGATCE
jgi:hypothetical protein